MKLVFIHGRSQQGKSSEALLEEWLVALDKGLEKNGVKRPRDLDISVPFYGDILADFASKTEIPLASGVRAKSSNARVELDVFKEEVLREMAQRNGIDNAGVLVSNTTRGGGFGDVRAKGLINSERVLQFVRAIDSYWTPASGFTIEAFLNDVAIYTSLAGIRDAVDAIVEPEIGKESTVIVSHSLGTVVAYSILRRLGVQAKITLLVTLGSPLGIHAIRDRFRPIMPLPGVRAWQNYYDPRDIVALYPLDAENFPMSPVVTNNGKIDNHTDNRHGIAGYLDDKAVAAVIARTWA